MREGVKQILSDTDDIVVSDEASTGKEAIELTQRNSYDVVLLDITMPGRDGLETLRDLRAARAEDADPHPEHLPRGTLRGAGLRAVLRLRGEGQRPGRAYSRHTQGRSRRQVHQSEGRGSASHTKLDKDFTKPPHELLSDREYQVMRMLRDRKTIKEIALRPVPFHQDRQHLPGKGLREAGHPYKRRPCHLCH